MNSTIPVETVPSMTALNLSHLEVCLQRKLGGRIRDLQLLLLECGIILRGFAHTYHAKQLAQQAVMSETCVPILANEIEVGGTIS